ncbi:MAG: cation-translocating P-type ATPase C-terminal domain-containing protein [Ginsengibacter sp.]
MHVIFLELIMWPTCSIVYENEPLEKNSMLHPPRKITSIFFNIRELTISILQGLAITAGTLFMYPYSVQNGYGEQLTRSMVFTTLIFANISLTLVNRSFFASVFTSFKVSLRATPYSFCLNRPGYLRDGKTENKSGGHDCSYKSMPCQRHERYKLLRRA